jgi:hypothetical protein
MAPAVPGGAIPSPTVGTNTAMEGEISIDDGRLVYTPVTMKGGFYLLGHDRWRAIDAAGAAIVLAVLVAAAVHGGIRFILWRSRRSRT